MFERKEYLVDTLINMTSNVIETYETCSGCVWKFDPFLQLPSWKQQIILETYKNANDLTFCYVMDEDYLEEALERGIMLDEIAFIKDHAAGRVSHKTGKPHEVYYFAWAKDPEIFVRVYSRHIAKNAEY